MSKPLVPADLLKSLQAAEKPASAVQAAKPKAPTGPKPAARTSTRSLAKAGAPHTRMSNRGK